MRSGLNPSHPTKNTGVRESGELPILNPEPYSSLRLSAVNLRLFLGWYSRPYHSSCERRTADDRRSPETA